MWHCRKASSHAAIVVAAISLSVVASSVSPGSLTGSIQPVYGQSEPSYVIVPLAEVAGYTECVPTGVDAGDIAQIIQYSSGWQLVAGTTGSCLVGNEGLVYHINPLVSGLIQYLSLPANVQLDIGFSYWVYFPKGGQLQMKRQDGYSGEYKVHYPFEANKWTVVAAESYTGPSVLATPDAVLAIFDQGQYRESAQIDVGHAAWIWPRRAGVDVCQGMQFNAGLEDARACPILPAQP